MKLTNAEISGALARPGQTLKLRDGNGLYLFVTVRGKYWRYDYRFMGKRKTLSLGAYPAITLKAARLALFEAKSLLEAGSDPGYIKSRAKYVSPDRTLKAVALEWVAQHDCAEITRNDAKQRLERNVFPVLGTMAIDKVKPIDVIHVGRRLQSRGVDEEARRTCRVISQVMRYGVYCGLIDSDPCRDIKGALGRRKGGKRLAAITDPVLFGELLRKIDSYQLNIIFGAALKISAHVALRPTELRAAKWDEINLEKNEWFIPASRMKKEREHFVPISKQVNKLLSDLKPITGQSELLFPSHLKKGFPFSDGTLRKVLAGLGYADKHTPHGFRSSFSTMAHESGLFESAAIECQLAHLDKNRVRAAYNRSQYADERIKLMQWWSDQIDLMRAG